ncbi:hypothetical protein JQF37_29515 [Pseudomonas sp. MIL9]|nr:hypothetical protein [Pseudomonas sp. MIL9]
MADITIIAADTTKGMTMIRVMTIATMTAIAVITVIAIVTTETTDTSIANDENGDGSIFSYMNPSPLFRA